MDGPLKRFKRAKHVEYIEQEVKVLEHEMTPEEIQEGINKVLEGAMKLTYHVDSIKITQCKEKDQEGDMSPFRRLPDEVRKIIRTNCYILPVTTWLHSTRISGRELTGKALTILKLIWSYREPERIRNKEIR